MYLSLMTGWPVVYPRANDRERGLIEIAEKYCCFVIIFYFLLKIRDDVH